MSSEDTGSLDAETWASDTTSDSESSTSTSDVSIESKALHTTLDCYAQVTSLEFSRDGKLFAVGSEDNARVWRVDPGGVFAPVDTGRFITGGEGPLYVTFTQDQRSIWVVSEKGSIARQDIHPHAKIALSTQTGCTISCVEASPDGRLLAAGIQAAVKLFDCATGNEVATLPADKIEDRITSLSFSIDGERLTGASAGGMVVIWDVAGRKLVAGPFPRAAPTLLVNHSQSGDFIAAAGFEGRVKVWKKPEGGGRDEVIKAAVLYAGRKDNVDEKDESASTIQEVSRTNVNRDDDDFDFSLSRRQTNRRRVFFFNDITEEISSGEKRNTDPFTKRLFGRFTRDMLPKTTKRRDKENEIIVAWLSTKSSAITGTLRRTFRDADNRNPGRPRSPRRRSSYNGNKKSGTISPRVVFTARNKSRIWVRRESARRGSQTDTDNGRGGRTNYPPDEDVDSTSSASYVEKHPLRDILVMHLCGIRDHYA